MRHLSDVGVAVGVGVEMMLVGVIGVWDEGIALDGLDEAINVDH